MDADGRRWGGFRVRCGSHGKFGVWLDEARLALIAGVFALIGGLGRPFRAGFMGGKPRALPWAGMRLRRWRSICWF